MRSSPLLCVSCGEKIGTHIEYDQSFFGQDAPEDIINPEHEGCENLDGDLICATCADKLHEKDLEEEKETE